MCHHLPVLRIPEAFPDWPLEQVLSKGLWGCEEQGSCSCGSHSALPWYDTNWREVVGLLPAPKGSSSQGFLTALWFELSSQITAHFSTVWLRPSRAVGTAPVEQKEAGRRPGRGGGQAKAPNEQNSDGSYVFQTSRRLPQRLRITAGGFYSKVMTEFP